MGWRCLSAGARSPQARLVVLRSSAWGGCWQRASAEAAVAAGADRVEGTLFGNGERTGNVDVVTLAGNLFSWGIDPGLDLSDIGRTRAVAKAATGMAVGPRTPYAGDLAWVAYSGSHQDAIAKGLAAVGPDRWEVPYLPVDPADLGRALEPVIRINSQSGRGGVAHVLGEAGWPLPRAMATAVSAEVQRHCDTTGTQLDAESLVELFTQRWVSPDAVAIEVRSSTFDDTTRIEADITVDGVAHHAAGEGSGPIAAAVDALGTLGVEVEVADYHETARSSGTDAHAVAYVAVRRPGSADIHWGAAASPSTLRAALDALAVAVSSYG